MARKSPYLIEHGTRILGDFGVAKNQHAAFEWDCVEDSDYSPAFVPTDRHPAMLRPIFLRFE